MIDARGISNRPEFMAHAIRGGEIDLGRHQTDLGEQVIDDRRRPVDQKGRSRLGIQRLDLAHPIVLLHGAGEFMLFDPLRVIGRHRGARDQPGLTMTTHGQSIHVIAGCRIPHQQTLGEHPVQVLAPLGIDRRRIRIRPLGQIDLGARDMQKAPGTPLDHPPGLGGIHHVIGRRGDLRGTARGRTQTGKGFDQGHKGLVGVDIVSGSFRRGRTREKE